MTITINGADHNVPSDVSAIPLGKFVEWYSVYGKELDEQLDAILNEEKEEFEKAIDLQLHLDKEAISWYSFFTGFNFFESYDYDLTDILIQYRIIRELIKESEQACRTYPITHEWNGTEWAIQDFAITPGSRMTFDEIITSKEVMRQINKLGQGRWEALAYLCCIFLRLKDESYKAELIDPDKERFALMQTVPLDIALSVAFFLNSSINTFRKVLLSSANPEAEVIQPPN
jgi:hypothetical protein